MIWPGWSISFDSPAWLALTLTLAAVAWWLLRDPGGWFSLRNVLWGVALLSLALAAAGPVVWLERPRPLAVLVDLSASTRTAAWRDADWLTDMLAGLGTPEHGLWAFGDRLEPLRPAEVTERLSRETTFEIPRNWLGEEVSLLILTDGHVSADLHGLPATVAYDPRLNAPADRAVERLAYELGDLLATARGDVDPGLRLDGVLTTQAGAAAFLRTPADRVDGPVRAVAGGGGGGGGGDAWPENDLLTIGPPVSMPTRWLWASSERSAPSGFEWHETPGQIPEETAVLVLDNLPADVLSGATAGELADFIRNRGGSTILVGGDRTFGPGGWAGTAIDALSPLASEPPQPERTWLLLIDASGSMAGGNPSRFHAAVTAGRSLLETLPAESRARAGSFADEVRWWSSEAHPRQLARELAVPPDLSPRGRTNLGPAIEAVLDSIPTEREVGLIIITDSQAPLADPAALAEQIRTVEVDLRVLNVGDEADPGLLDLIDQAGGVMTQEPDARRWGQALRELTRAGDEAMVRGEATVEFQGLFGPLGAVEVETWNATWPREDAVPLARSETEPMPPRVATRREGLGRVTAFSFAVDPATLAAAAELVEQRATDPSVAATWRDGPTLQVDVEAQGASTVEAVREGAAYAAEPVGPGRWRIRIAGERSPAVVRVFVDGDLADQQATAGRYAPEFDAIGNHPAGLTSLAGDQGEVISTAEIGQWRSPTRLVRFSALPWLALAGAMAGGSALLMGSVPSGAGLRRGGGPVV